ncbi:hypothetical protein F3Y22_tig00000329pilonHSYRG00024 [Hibiscus syriacus]|uniref:Uncharacterized protein n=1 Tax=Hibiscus syriacus TaxID=106335 RepID=A0A6A3D2G8_HIBSY|nr:hypothetical protein F3Y22_tig00000329pilonHSYRG00024 [Hibiscus syriacus]
MLASEANPILFLFINFLIGGGELYTWGSNENGCLVLLMFSMYRKEFKILCEISCLQGFLWLEAYSSDIRWQGFHMGLGSSHGTFSEDGHSSGGQLGHGSDVDYIKPTMVHVGENVKALEVMYDFQYSGCTCRQSESEQWVEVSSNLLRM